MPNIYDNIEIGLLPALRETLGEGFRADFCVGYFNLRGWRELGDIVSDWPGGAGRQCRVLVGMQMPPHEELRAALRVGAADDDIDQQTAVRLKRRMAEQFREQLTLGWQTNEDEAGLRRLSAQLKAGQVVVKLFLRHTLHAKLYLVHRPDSKTPLVGYLGSSNLTFSGLVRQGELNVDVVEQDAATKLQAWFDARWADRYCLDISAELAQIIDESWAREDVPSPYEIYLKIAYHLSHEARAGLATYGIPHELRGELFEFQAAAVKIAAHYLNRRGGVIIGDVVGLGKTLMATALAKVLQEDQLTDTLIVCPVNLVSMWREHVERYGLIAKVLPISQVTKELPNLRRYRVVLIDESHNLRNREGRRYRAIQEYVASNESRCILLSATPYNKSYLDLSSQLRLFVPEDADLGVRPEALMRELGETEFIRRHQAPVRSLAAFEKSEFPDDWRDLMRLYLVRRTRSFIQANYAELDEAGRRFLRFPDGRRSYFPVRRPKTATFEIREGDPYERLFAPEVVQAINELKLPRYGLGNYVAARPNDPPTTAEAETLRNLGRAGQRLIGFSRTNLFKRLESAGPAFLQSLERHALRNFVFLHAIDAGLPLPLGAQAADILAVPPDQDDEAELGMPDDDAADDPADAAGAPPDTVPPDTVAPNTGAAVPPGETAYRRRAADVYAQYAGQYRRRFRWLRPTLFAPSLRQHLELDARAILEILDRCGAWDASRDAKLAALIRLLQEQHPTEKVLVFTQFADTAAYLAAQLAARGVTHSAAATGSSYDPTALAWRFSPRSNRKVFAPTDELRVLVATDVLSEGQNLQDAHIIVNYDLPWAIIRLIQRAGRVDRIGQEASEILSYSFLPADGVERILNLRSRVRQRLKENAEVVGTDERFFEDDENDALVVDLYHEKSGMLDGDADTEVDLASYAFQIWKNATDRDPTLLKRIADLPDVAFSTRAHEPAPGAPQGVLVYAKTADDNDALAWLDQHGNSVTQSQLRILQAAECPPGTPAVPRDARHHDLVRQGVERIASEEGVAGGQLGRPSGARFRTYERLKRHQAGVKGGLFDTQELARAIEEIYRFPLLQSATDTLNRQLKSGIGDQALADLVVALRADDRLCRVDQEDDRPRDPRIICSLGLFSPTG